MDCAWKIALRMNILIFHNNGALNAIMIVNNVKEEHLLTVPVVTRVKFSVMVTVWINAFL
jgi:hypothetical protein